MTVFSVPGEPKSVRTSDQFHDCVLVAKGRAIKVHKSVIGAQSPVLEAALAGNKPMEPININSDHGPALAMVEYLYTKDYDEARMNNTEFKSVPSYMESHPFIAAHSKLVMFHVFVNGLARYYKIPGLVALSQKKMDENLGKSSPLLEIPSILKRVHDKPGDEYLHEAIAREAATNKADLFHSIAFADLDIPVEFSVRLLRASFARERKIPVKGDSEKIALSPQSMGEGECVINELQVRRDQLKAEKKQFLAERKQLRSIMTKIEGVMEEVHLENPNFLSENRRAIRDGSKKEGVVVADAPEPHDKVQPEPTTEQITRGTDEQTLIAQAANLRSARLARAHGIRDFDPTAPGLVERRRARAIAKQSRLMQSRIDEAQAVTAKDKIHLEYMAKYRRKWDDVQKLSIRQMLRNLEISFAQDSLEKEEYRAKWIAVHEDCERQGIPPPRFTPSRESLRPRPGALVRTLAEARERLRLAEERPSD